MGFEEAFQAADSAVRAVRNDGLRDIERVVLEGSWNRQTYQTIASAAGYTEGYLSRDVGPALWSVLSAALGMQVKKTNFRTAIERWSKQHQSRGEKSLVTIDDNGHQPVAVADGITKDRDIPPIDVSEFRGRAATLQELADWIVQDGGRLLCLLGMPGVGKTWLAVKLSQILASHFQRILYRPLSDRPTPLALTQSLLTRLQVPPQPDATLQECLDLLVKELAQQKSLVILDGTEVFSCRNTLAGTYEPAFEAYRQVLEALSIRDHQSCVLWVGREPPRAAAHMASASCRIHLVTGLTPNELPALTYWPVDLQATETDWQHLYQCYGGVPMFVVQEIVPRLSSFSHHLQTCLQALEQDRRPIRTYLDNWLAPLSEIEWQVLTWLMISRRPLSLSQLNQCLGPLTPLPAIESLCYRGVCRAVMNGEPGWELALPELLHTALQGRFLEAFRTATDIQQVELLHRYPLIQTQAPEMVRQWQRQTLLEAISDLLAVSRPHLADKQAFVQWALQQSQQLYDSLAMPGYSAGNLINLAQYWQVSLVEVDFQGLQLQDADLQSDHFQGVAFAGADLSHTLLAKPLGQCPVLAISPDQQQVAVGDQDGRLLLWNIRDGRLQRAMLTVPEAIRVICFSADGETLAEGRQNGEVRLWDLRGDYVPELFATTVGALQTLLFSPDKDFLVGGDDAGYVYVWRLASGEEVHRIAAHGGAVTAIACSPCSQRLTTCGQDCAAVEWHLQTGESLHRFQGRLTNLLGTVTYLPAPAAAGVQAAVVGRDEGQLVVWDLPSARPLRVMNEPCELFMAMAMSPDGRYLAASDVSNTVSVWEVETRSRLYQISESLAPVEALMFSPDSRELMTGCDYAVQLWQVQTGQCLRSWRSDRHPANKLTLAPAPLQLLSSHDDQTVRCWQFSPGRQRWLPHERLQVPSPGIVNTIATSPAGQYWAIGTEAGIVHVWQPAQQKWLSLSIRLPNSITALALSPDGTLLAAGDVMGTVALWNLPDRIFRWQKTQTHADRVMALAFSPDGQRVYSGSRDRTVQGWDYRGTPITHLNDHRRRVHTLCVTATGETLYSGSYDGTVRCWNLANQTCIDLWQPEDRFIHAVTLDTQHRAIAIVSDTQTLEIWDLATHSCRASLPPHDETVWHVSVSPDGQALVSAGQDGEIRLWSLDTGQPQGYLRVDRPYEGMQIGGCHGLTDSERQMLYSLGATDY